MKRKSILFGSFYFLILTALLHFLAIFFYLYWTVPWFDMIVHFSGGVAATLFIVWIASFAVPLASLFSWKFSFFVLVLLGSFSVGVLWEIFEYRYGITFPALRHYRFETLKDLVMDVVGGTAVYLYFIATKEERRGRVITDMASE